MTLPKELSRLKKIAFSLERVYGRIFLTEFGGIFFAGFFSSAMEKIYREKNPAENQSMKLQVNSGEIRVCKSDGKTMQNVGNRRLTPKSAKFTC